MRIPGLIRRPFTALTRHFQLQPPPDTPYVLDTKVVPVVNVHTHIEDFPLSNVGNITNGLGNIFLPGTPVLQEGCWHIYWSITHSAAVAADNDSFIDVRVPTGSASSYVVLGAMRTILAGTHRAEGMVEVHLPESWTIGGQIAGAGVGNFSSWHVLVQRV